MLSRSFSFLSHQLTHLKLYQLIFYKTTSWLVITPLVPRSSTQVLRAGRLQKDYFCRVLVNSKKATNLLAFDATLAMFSSCLQAGVHHREAIVLPQNRLRKRLIASSLMPSDFQCNSKENRGAKKTHDCCQQGRRIVYKSSQLEAERKKSIQIFPKKALE